MLIDARSGIGSGSSRLLAMTEIRPEYVTVGFAKKAWFVKLIIKVEMSIK